MGRQIKHDVEFQSLSPIPGFTYTGGGNKWAKKAGLWVPAPTGVPFLEDGGFGIWDTREQLNPLPLDFSTGSSATNGWVGESTAQGNFATGPDGEQSATLVTPNVIGNTLGSTAATNNRRLREFVAANGSFTHTIFVKAHLVPGAVRLYVIDRQTDTARASIIGVTTDEWVEMRVRGTTSGAQAGVRFLISCEQPTLVWGANCKPGVDIGDPVILQSTGAAATRPLDNPSISGLSLPAIHHGFIRVKIAAPAPGSECSIFQLDDGSNNNRVLLRRQANGQVDLRVQVGGTTQVTLALGAAPPSGDIAVAWRAKPADYAAVMHSAGAVASDSASATLPIMTDMILGNVRSLSTPLNGYLIRLGLDAGEATNERLMALAQEAAAIDMTYRVQFAGASQGLGLVTGDLEAIGHAQMEGGAAGQGSASGNLTAAPSPVTLGGQAQGSAAGAGDLAAGVPAVTLGGAATAPGQASGDLDARPTPVTLGGTAAGQGSGTGNVHSGPEPADLSGTVPGAATPTGNLTATPTPVVLGGAAPGAASGSGDLTAGAPEVILGGSAAGEGQTVGNLTAGLPPSALGGAASGQGVVSGNLSVGIHDLLPDTTGVAAPQTWDMVLQAPGYRHFFTLGLPLESVNLATNPNLPVTDLASTGMDLSYSGGQLTFANATSVTSEAIADLFPLHPFCQLEMDVHTQNGGNVSFELHKNLTNRMVISFSRFGAIACESIKNGTSQGYVQFNGVSVPAAPYKIRVQIQGRSLLVWYVKNGASTYCGRYNFASIWDFRNPAETALWKVCLNSRSSAAPSSIVVSGIAAKLSGNGHADPRVVSYEDGTPIQKDGQVHILMTTRGAEIADAFQGIYRLNPVTGAITMTGALFANRGDGIWRNDNAGHLFYDRISETWRIMLAGHSDHPNPRTLWGASFTTDVREGVHVIPVTEVNMPNQPTTLWEDVYPIWDAEAGASPTAPAFSAAYSALLAGTSNVDVLLVGDSITAGNGSTAAGRWGNSISAGYVRRLADLFNGAGGRPKGSWQSWMGDHNTGSSFGLPGHDNRITMGSGWGYTNSFSPPSDFTTMGGFMVVCTGSSGSTAAFSFEPTTQTDTLDIYYVTAINNGQFTVKVNGGATLQTVDSNTNNVGGANRVSKVTVTAPLGANRWDVARNGVGGSVYIIGMVARNSAEKEINFISAGHNGGKIFEHSADTQPWHAMKVIDVLQPKLTIICMTVNDWNANTDRAVFITETQKLITKAKLYGDVMLMSGPPSNPSGNASVAQQASFISAYDELAATNGLRHINMTQRWTSYAASTSLYVDSLHPNATGYIDMAAAVDGGISALLSPAPATGQWVATASKDASVSARLEASNFMGPYTQTATAGTQETGNQIIKIDGERYIVAGTVDDDYIVRSYVTLSELGEIDTNISTGAFRAWPTVFPFATGTGTDVYMLSFDRTTVTPGSNYSYGSLFLYKLAA